MAMTAASSELKPAPIFAQRWRTLAQAFADGMDNFLLLRFVAASMVIYAHSYALSGMDKADIFVRAGWGTNGGGIAVNMFFCISGFLVTGSLVRWHNVFAFIKARALRLLPAYAVCLLICAYVLGPMVTTLPVDAYFAQPSTHTYVSSNLALRHLQFLLPGVFESNPFAGAVNGSIWTLPAEATMYLWLAVLGLIGIYRRSWTATCALIVLALIAREYWLSMPLLVANPNYLPFAAQFALGSLCYLHRQRIPLGHAWMVAFVVLAYVSHGSALYSYTFALAQTYFCFWFAYCIPWRGFNRLGDYSYGIYLWGFPCEQLVVLWLGHPRPTQISLLAFPLALALAVASWHLIEQPALRLKKGAIWKMMWARPEVQQRREDSSTGHVPHTAQSDTIAASVLLERLKPGVVLTSTDITHLHDLLEVRDRRRELHSAVSESAGEIAQRVGAAVTKAFVMLIGVWHVLRGKSESLLGKLEKPWVFLLAALALQLPLILNFGYFSHDELQWIALADQPTLAQVPWFAWLDLQAFQDRPLTFNLWLLVSHYFGYEPVLMHLVRVLFGTLAAWLLRAVLLEFGTGAKCAGIAVCLFLFSPYVVFTHAWIGTFADSIYLIFLLGAILLVLRRHDTPRTWLDCMPAALGAALLTALALFSKESAVTFPVLLLVVGLRRRDRQFVAALAGSSLVVAAYLALRLQTILYSQPAGNAYAWSLFNIPERLAEYAAFPFLVDCFEVKTAGPYWSSWVALLCLAGMAASVASAGWRRVVLLFVGWIVALGPVIILGFSSDNYAYVASAFACGLVAASWNKLHRFARLALACIALLTTVHSYHVIQEIRHIGRIQRNLYNDLPEIVANSDVPVLIKPQRIQEDFVLQRLLYKVPSYRRMQLTDRVVGIPFAQATPQPEFLMTGSGHLIPAR